MGKAFLVALLVLLPFGCGVLYEDPDVRYQRAVDEHFESRRREDEQKTGTFPQVTIGMSYEQLKRKIVELNPPYYDRSTMSSQSNIWVEHESKYFDTQSITYCVLQGRITEHTPATVIVTVKDGVVIGYSK